MLKTILKLIISLIALFIIAGCGVDVPQPVASYEPSVSTPEVIVTAAPVISTEEPPGTIELTLFVKSPEMKTTSESEEIENIVGALNEILNSAEVLEDGETPAPGTLFNVTLMYGEETVSIIGTRDYIVAITKWRGAYEIAVENEQTVTEYRQSTEAEFGIIYDLWYSIISIDD